MPNTTNPRRAKEIAMPKRDAPGASAPHPASASTMPTTATQGVVSGATDQTAIGEAAPKNDSLFDPSLAFAADVVDDLERSRIANENRLRQLTRSTADTDGEERGFGLDQSHPDVATLAAIVDALSKVEAVAVRNVEKKMAAHPLGPWAKAQRGIGAKQCARLLAATGDPYWNTLYDRPRTVSELWAYCGYDPKQKRRKGVKSNWSAVAKSRAYLIAESCVKAGKATGTIYYQAYAARKAATDGRAHAEPCVRCGPAGHPALTGSPWSLGHRHADALRVVAKEILKGLWVEARRLHQLPAGQSILDTQTAYAGRATTSPGHGQSDAQTGSARGVSKSPQRSAA